MNKNVKKAAIALLYTLSIVVAIGIGMMRTEKNIDSEGKGGPDCDYSGYTDFDCRLFRNICQNGRFKLEHKTASETGDFKEAGSWSARGNCSGNTECVTPESKDLTSVGCAE